MLYIKHGVKIRPSHSSLVKANEKRQETVPFRECLPSIIKLWKKQGWLLIDAEMSIVKVKITDDMPTGD
jgi:hypothetical protein